MKKSIAVLWIIFMSVSAFCQKDSIQLIKPKGLFSVGTMTYEWTDETRELKLTSHETDKRTIVVQLWYPAAIDSNSILAPYSTLSKDYRKVNSNSYLRPSFTEEIDHANLIIFSPGRGVERFLYTTIIEELASHGFVVASVDMPQIGYVIYQDGLVVRPSSRFRPPRGMMAGPYEKVDQFFEEPTLLGFEDLSYAFQKITELSNGDPNNRFRGKINVDEIGLFGHSLGGRIAGKFAAENKNVRAYISMEGIPPRKIRYDGKIVIPVALLCSSGTWPYAKENYYSLIENRNNTVFMIELLGFGHNSVTDNPMIYPDSFQYEIEPIRGLEICKSIVLQYFRSIFDGNSNFAESLGNLEKVKFQIYK